MNRRKGSPKTESLGDIDENTADPRYNEDRMIDEILERDDERSTEAAGEKLRQRTKTGFGA